MIHTLPSPKQNNKAKRRGRGVGTGVGGHTTGKGMKGQKSRSGYKKPAPDFEGGQNPLSKRTPKLKGFKKGYFESRTKKVVVKLSEIESKAKQGDTINEVFLMEHGLISNVSHKQPIIKILFDKDISKKIAIDGVAVSQKAKSAIEKAGGSVK